MKDANDEWLHLGDCEIAKKNYNKSFLTPTLIKKIIKNPSTDMTLRKVSCELTVGDEVDCNTQQKDSMNSNRNPWRA